MNEDTPITDARWETHCWSFRSWYQIAEEMKLDCRQLERELTALTEQRDRLAEAPIRQEEIAIGLTDRDNLDIRVDWINALRTIVSRRLPKNKSGMSLISDIDLMLADDDERIEALEKIKAKYKL